MNAGHTAAAALAQFFEALETSLREGHFVKLVLAKPRGGATDLLRWSVRFVALKGEAALTVVQTHTRRDVTENFSLTAGLTALKDAVAAQFCHAHLSTTDEDIQMLTSKKGQRTLSRSKSSPLQAQPSVAHDRVKQRLIHQDRPWLTALGVTDEGHQVVPAMSRKWKQINKFVEVFGSALEKANLPANHHVSVADFGSGKGYLTFAVHDFLTTTLKRSADVLGVELRADLVSFCNVASTKLQLNGLRFEEGDVSRSVPEKLDVMIALHACDTATDHAIHVGVRTGASVILCSPCCHKQLRPQLMSPHPLQPLLQHGVHLGQQAEMLTDGLRAMLLDACGYETQVFEFVALEHTQKNKMILAVKRPVASDNALGLAQIRELKNFYGIRDQCLETLLRQSGLLAARPNVQPGNLNPI